MAKTCLGIFVKFPEPGRVKTRLAAEIGDKRAAVLYHGMVDTVFQIAEECSEMGVDVIAFFDGFRSVKDYQNEWPDFSFRWEPQGEGDLGTRLTSAFELMTNEYEHTLVIGTDCLQISADFLVQAGQELEKHDVVIGPAIDGGYYLIGMKKLHRDLFQQIPWSTNKVLEFTFQRFKENKLSSAVLDLFRDIDTLQDLKELGLISSQN